MKRKKEKKERKGITEKNPNTFPTQALRNILTLKMDRQLLPGIVRKMAFGLEAKTFLRFFSHVSDNLNLQDIGKCDLYLRKCSLLVFTFPSSKNTVTKSIKSFVFFVQL